MRTFLKPLQAGVYNKSHLIKNLFRWPKENVWSFISVSTEPSILERTISSSNKSKGQFLSDCLKKSNS